MSSKKRLGRDLISSLPDEILGKILSCLPTQLAASTSVLSKRWRNVLALVDKVDLHDASGGGGGGGSFPEFVEKVLALVSNRPDGDEDEDEDEDDYSDNDGEDVIFGDVTDLVIGISHVKTLHLSPDSLEVFHFCCKSIPVFHNLLKLSFESKKEKGWQVLPLLLNNSPKLETLVIKGLVHQVTDRCGDACPCIPWRKMKKKKKKKKKKTTMEEGVCCLLTCRVKVLNISGYQGTCRELKQMRHFLGNLKCLETVNVGVEVDHQEEEEEDDAYNNRYMRITNSLMNLSRVSSNCKISFL